MIVDCLTKIVYYESVKVIIDVSDLIKLVIINVVIYYYVIPDLIVIDQGSLFILKFWSLLYYFLEIKKWLSIAFYPQING